MKIYDMVEGKWIQDKEPEKKKKQEAKNYKGLDVNVRLVTYDEEKGWIKKKRHQ